MEEARPLYEEALAVKRETLGDRHPITLTSIYNLASLLQALDEVDAAVPLFKRRWR